MTAFQLILLNSVSLGLCILIAYLITHGSKNQRKDDSSLKHHH